MSDYLPDGKTQLQAWMNNFITVAGAQMASLGLTAADLSALSGVQGTFTTAVANVKTAKGTLKSATEAELLATKSLNSTVRGIVRRIQSNASVSPTVKGQLGIATHSAPKNHAPPITPTDVMADGTATGVNTIKWNRTGNKSNTVFVIEALIGASADWTAVGSATATKFDHTGQTPGVKVSYRVSAQRGGAISVPTPAVTVYGASTGLTLTLAKAA